MKKYIGLAIVSVMIGLVIWQFVSEQKPAKPEVQASQEEFEEEHRAILATDFTLPMLSGGNLTLSETRGKMTIINFWASWCAPCKMEAPHLQEFYEEYSDRVEIVAVNNTSKDKREDVAAFVEQYGLTFPVLLDETGEINTMYGAFAIPTTVFLNEKGEIIHEYVGPMEKQFLINLLEL